MQSDSRNTLDDGQLLLEIGHVALAQGMFHDGLAIMDHLIFLEPDLPHPRIGKALALFMLGHQQKAVDELSGVVELFPEAVFARSLLARFLNQMRLPGAEEMALEALSMNPPNFVAAIAREVLGDHVVAASAPEEEAKSQDGNVTDDDGVAETTSTTYPPGFRGGRV